MERDEKIAFAASEGKCVQKRQVVTVSFPAAFDTDEAHNARHANVLAELDWLSSRTADVKPNAGVLNGGRDLDVDTPSYYLGREDCPKPRVPMYECSLAESFVGAIFIAVLDAGIKTLPSDHEPMGLSRDCDPKMWLVQGSADLCDREAIAGPFGGMSFLVHDFINPRYSTEQTQALEIGNTKTHHWFNDCTFAARAWSFHRRSVSDVSA